jgi:hypothetical protein
MKSSSESPSIPTNAHLLQFTPHAKQNSSKNPTPPKLELQVKHEAEEVPSFRTSPSSSPSHKEWRLTTPVSHETHLQIGPVYWPSSLDISQHPCANTIHGSSVGMATRSRLYADVRSSTGLDPCRGTDCVLCTTRGRTSIGCAGPRSTDGLSVDAWLRLRGKGRRCCDYYCCETSSCTASASILDATSRHATHW